MYYNGFSGGEDHPRSRGKDKLKHLLSGQITGSPPLAREGPKLGPVGFKFGGITPARAGRTR